MTGETCPTNPSSSIAGDDRSSAKRQGMQNPGESSDRDKRRRVSYDPDVPMSRSDRTAWRREQRRERNRQSAAASRQRQRDKITHLESEVQEWRDKVEHLMGKLKELEKKTNIACPLLGNVVSPEAVHSTGNNFTHQQALDTNILGMVRGAAEHSVNMISRQALSRPMVSVGA